MFVLFWGIFITSSHTRRSQVRAVLGSLFCSFAQPRSRAVLGRSRNCWLIRSRAGREWAGGRQHWAVTPCDPLARCALKKPCSLCCLGCGMDCSTTPPWWVPLSIHSHSRVESELGKPSNIMKYTAVKVPTSNEMIFPKNWDFKIIPAGSVQSPISQLRRCKLFLFNGRALWTNWYFCRAQSDFPEGVSSHTQAVALESNISF